MGDRSWPSDPWRRCRSGEHLSGDRLTVVPFGGRPVVVVAGFKPRQLENSTPRIPEPVLGPFLTWCLFYVQVASVDILAARAELASYPADSERLAARRSSAPIIWRTLDR